MSIPRIIYIDSHKWQIKQGDQDTMKLFAIEAEIDFKYKENIYGFCSIKERIIIVDKDIKESDKLSTILHEIIHVIAENLSEKQVVILERGLFTVLRRNKNLKF